MKLHKFKQLYNNLQDIRIIRSYFQKKFTNNRYVYNDIVIKYNTKENPLVLTKIYTIKQEI